MSHIFKKGKKRKKKPSLSRDIANNRSKHRDNPDVRTIRVTKIIMINVKRSRGKD